MSDITIIGAGLAGCEAAWQVAEQGLTVDLYEMRPLIETGAHNTGFLAELICSNSLGSNLSNRASGILKNELRLFPSLLLKVADRFSLPAGGALAVDRELFAKEVTDIISSHPRIHLIREEVQMIPDTPTILSSGPLTSAPLAADTSHLTGSDNLYFYDAIAPIVAEETINMEKAFIASRYQRTEAGEGDYINCPFSKEEYDHFIEELSSAERIPLHNIETSIDEGVDANSKVFFEGCLPVEVIAQRGHNSMAFGPMRPVGLFNPHTGKRPYAVVQLRQDNLQGSLYNLVGFQTNLKYTEQKRVFRLIPGLENATFVRYGQMHRNTYVSSPNLLDSSMQMRKHPHLFFAGQITGMEGYVGNIASGLISGINISRWLSGKDLLHFPQESMMGALCHYITHSDAKYFQPMKANLGILPPLQEKIKSKKERGEKYAERALITLKSYLREHCIDYIDQELST